MLVTDTQKYAVSKDGLNIELVIKNRLFNQLTITGISKLDHIELGFDDTLTLFQFMNDLPDEVKSMFEGLL